MMEEKPSACFFVMFPSHGGHGPHLNFNGSGRDLEADGQPFIHGWESSWRGDSNIFYFGKLFFKQTSTV